MWGARMLHDAIPAITRSKVMHSSLRAVACAAAIAFALPAHSLGTVHETVIPPSEVLYDGATGLDWLLLDYDSLPGTTWDQAVSHAPGFRLATRSELETFFAGLALELDGRVHGGEHGSVTFLLEEWGTLSTVYWDNPQSSLRAAFSDFWLADPSGTPGTHLTGFFYQQYEEFHPGFGELWLVGVSSSPDNTSSPGLSAALVRVHVNAIPEPETYLLLAGGLAALFLRRAALEARRSPSRGLRRGVA